MAKDVSFGSAFIVGDKAEMAVTPQMLVPVAISELILSLIPIFLPNQGIKVSPAATDAATTGSPIRPDVNKSTKLSLRPISTIEAGNTDLDITTRPGFRASIILEGSTEFKQSPSKIDTEIGLIGD
jgi:hypothetical protein